MNRLLLLLFALLCIAATPIPPSDTPANAPQNSLVDSLTSGSHIIKSFDFDERKLGNFDRLPMFWSKVAGRGYPLYTGGEFDFSVGRSPVSFRLDLDGGSVAYQYQAGQLPVNPHADYLILGFVKTTPLAHARAEITAWFADGDDKILPATQVHSQRWASPDGKDDWHLLNLFISGNNPAIKSLVLQVGVLQPQQLDAASTLGKFQLYEQDLKGSAWFDDIAVFELPRISIRATATGGLFAPRKPAELTMVVSDVNHAPLNVSLTVRDPAGVIAHHQSWPIQPDPSQPWNQTLTLPALPPGLYIADMEISDSHGLLTRRTTQFACLADLGLVTHPAPEFGLIASHWPQEAWPDLPLINAQISTGLLELPAWQKESAPDAPRRQSPFDILLTSLQRQEVLTIAGFSHIPSALTAPANDPAPSAASQPQADPAWRSYVDFILARYATRIEYWQVTSDPADAAAHLPLLYSQTRAELATMVHTPRMLLPWNAMLEFDPRQFPGATLELSLPSDIKPQQIPAYIHSFTQNSTDVLALIEPLPDGTYARTERLADFAQRIVLARTTAAKAILIDLPMTSLSTLSGHTLEPSELLVVYRTLVQTLGAAAYKGPLPLEPGIRAFLFDRAGVGTLILWNEDPASDHQTITLPLGPTPRQIDLNGRISPISIQSSLATLTVGPTPIIIDNIDTRLAQLRGGFALGQTNFPAGAGSVATTLKLHNPYSQSINGTIRLLLPAGWSADPPSQTFSLAAGADLDQPVTIRYPFNEFAGPKVIRGRLTIEGTGLSMEIAHHITIASDAVEMECLAHFTPAGELLILQTITNTSAEPLNAQAFVSVPGMAQQRRFVVDLEPGATIIKRFIFPDAAPLAGKIAAAGLRQNDGTTLLTRSVPLN